MVVGGRGGAFKNKCSPLGGKGLEWSIYHGLKWCLSLTKVLIIPSEEELPAHYLPGNNNADTRPPRAPPPASPVSPVAACQLQHHSFNLNKRRAAGFIPRPALSLPPFSLFPPTLPRITSPRSAGCPPPPPIPPLPGQALDTHFLPFCEPALPHPSTPLGPDEPL